MQHSRWIFTDDELKNPSQCRQSDEFIALPLGHEDGVVVYRNGEPTTRWADGSEPIPDDVQELVRDVESFMTLDAEDIADQWRDVLVNEDGSFNSFM